MLRSTTPTPTQSTVVPHPRLKFGAPVAELSTLTKGLAALEKRPLAELLFKDVTAFNIPKIALSRTWKERWDTATLELSNSGITLMSSLLLPGLVRYPVNHLAQLSEKYVNSHYLSDEFSKVAPKLLAQKLPLLPAKMARLGVSFGFFFPFASAFWAAPFARNWLTMKRTQSSNFESMIGFDGTHSHRPHRSLPEEMAYQRNTALKTLGIGAGLGLGSLLTGGLLARSLGKNLNGALAQKLSTGQAQRWLEGVFKRFDLKGNQVEGQTATLIFWGLPAYLGWVHGARSGNERRERLIQSANAIFWFFFASKLTTPLWQAGYKNALKPHLAKCKTVLDKVDIQNGKNLADVAKHKVEERLLGLSYQDILKGFEADEPLRNQLLRLKNAKFALNDLGIPITTLAGVQLLNFNLTERKIKAAQKPGSSTGATQQKHLPGSLLAAGISPSASLPSISAMAQPFMGSASLPAAPSVVVSPAGSHFGFNVPMNPDPRQSGL